jgi:hypothetical protein
MSQPNCKLPTKRRPLYDNCSVLSKDGELLFRCSKKRVYWYLSKGLASLIQPSLSNPVEDPKVLLESLDSNDAIVIQLNFQTRGPGRIGNLFYLEDRQNRCVCCGSTQHLTLHHVIPDLYRQHMPMIIKSRSSFDVLPLCVICHDKYEKYAWDKKQSIAKLYGIPLEGQGWIIDHERVRIKRAANALLKHANKIPIERRIELAKIVYQYWQQPNLLEPFHTWSREQSMNQVNTLSIGDISLPQSVLYWMSQWKERERGPNFISHGAFVIQQLLIHQESTHTPPFIRWPDLEVFIQEWRQHFIDHTQPLYLSSYWQPHHPIYNE